MEKKRSTVASPDGGASHRTTALVMTLAGGLLGPSCSAEALEADAGYTATAAPPNPRVCTLNTKLELKPGARLLLDGDLLARLRTRAGAGDKAWAELKAQCDAHSGARIELPNGRPYPGYPNIGPGYQGGDYLDPMMALGLCYRTEAERDPAAASRYADAGKRLLAAMSTPVDQGGQRPSTDSGFGIRHFGVAMALGYDWLHPTLTPDLRTRVITSLNGWIDWYDQSGFINNDPIGNYFAGYLLAKTYAAIATSGENPKADVYWKDVEDRMWTHLVKPQFTAHMQGGGWPEGWGYGRRALRSVTDFLWAAKTGKDKDWLFELPQAREQAEYVRYFAWPGLNRMDDQGTVRANIDYKPSAGLLSALAFLMERTEDPAAARTRGFIADLIAAGADDRPTWQKFLHGDPAAPSARYDDRRLSYLARGPSHVAVRSTWDKDAVWGAFSAGPYINAQYSGEQLFNSGGLSVVQGGEPILVNASGWLPHIAGSAGEKYVHDENYERKSRRIYNTFYVDDPSNAYNPGQNFASPARSSAHVERYEDRGVFVRALGADIQDQYGAPAGNRPVLAYHRDLVYVRPGTFVLYDRTRVARDGADQWLAFHMPAPPATKTVPDQSQRRLDLEKDGRALGSLRLLLPRAATVTTSPLLQGVTRIEAHAPERGVRQTWLSVVTAGAAPDQERLSPEDGNVSDGAVLGVHVKGSREHVVLFPAAEDLRATVSTVSYEVRQGGDADHILLDVAPSTSGYSVEAEPQAGSVRITVRAGGRLQASEAGSLLFSVSRSGTVTDPAPQTPSVPGGGAGVPGTGSAPGAGAPGGSEPIVSDEDC
jgi:hypothetical protein